MSMIQVVTLLHQYQREVDSEGRLLAAPADYQLAQYLLKGPMSRLLGGGVSEPAGRFFERLRQWATNDLGAGIPFPTTEARKKEAHSKSAVSGWLKELHEAGLIRVHTEGRGSKATV